MSLLGLRNKLEKEKKRDYERRAKNFLEAYKEISKEHEIDMEPTLRYTDYAIIPSIGFKDIKGQNKELKQDAIQK